jgi:hypothetical protein
LTVNGALVSALGCSSPAELLQQPFRSFVHEDDLALVLDKLLTMESPGHSAMRQARTSSKDKSGAERDRERRSRQQDSSNRREAVPMPTLRSGTGLEASEIKHSPAGFDQSPEASTVVHSPRTAPDAMDGSGSSVGRATALARSRGGVGSSLYSSVEFTCRFVHATDPDGAPRWLTVKLAYGHSQPLLYGSARDVTFAKLHEAELARSEAAAVASSRAKAAFVANLSHELRTPLNGVCGMAALLAETHVDETQRDYIGTIASCAKHLLTVRQDRTGGRTQARQNLATRKGL